MRFLRNHWHWLAVLLICCGFVAYQIPLMHIPAYWDEAFPYSYAVRHMYDLGPTLLPTKEGMPSDLFTGHPPLFYFLQSWWMKIAGADVFSQRIFPVALSVASILLLFNIGRRHFGRDVGLVAALILATRTLFLAQASRVLPETMVVFFMLIALEFWLSRKFWLYLLPATCMLLTKEPSLTLIPLLCLWGLLREWQGGWKFWENSKPFFKVQLKSAFFTCLPVLLAAVFFILQNKYQGWYLFPRHMQMSLPFSQVLWRVAARLDEMFLRFGGFLLPVILLWGAVWVAILKTWPSRAKWLPIIMMALFIGGNIWGSSLNFYATARYVLFVVPILALMAAVIMNIAFQSRRWVMLLLGIVVSGCQLVGNYLDEDIGDSSRGYISRVKVMQEVVAWMKEHKVYEHPICARFLTGHTIRDFPPGYVEPEFAARKHTWWINEETQYYIHWEIDGALHEQLDSFPHEMIAWFDEGPAWASVYRVNHIKDSVPPVPLPAAVKPE